MKSLALTVSLFLLLGMLLAAVVSAGTVTDIDGNVYQTVTIGTQVWMAQNLKVTHYRNGDSIPNVSVAATWIALTTGALCSYDNDVNNVAIYGRLYNAYAVGDSRGLAPAGWHVPSDAEWQQLEMALGMSQATAVTSGYRGTTEGGKLKETGTVHWANPNIGATNENGFSALPGGFRSYDRGTDYFIHNVANFWTSTKNGTDSAWCRYVSYNHADVARSYLSERDGFSIRCVKDASCCVGKRGNVNAAGIIDLVDLSSLVNYLTGGGYILPCPEAANVNGIGIVDLVDLSSLVNYLIGGGFVPPSCP
jgi:uncharacterized protein (TIGR02145 family)